MCWKGKQIGQDFNSRSWYVVPTDLDTDPKLAQSEYFILNPNPRMRSNIFSPAPPIRAGTNRFGSTNTTPTTTVLYSQ